MVLLFGFVYLPGCKEKQSPLDKGSSGLSSGETSYFTAKEGNLSFYFLCMPNGELNNIPCNPSRGFGLLGAAQRLDNLRNEDVDSAFFLIGDLCADVPNKEDVLTSAIRKHETELIPEVIKALKPIAALPGNNDLVEFGVDYFLKWNSDDEIPFVCANLVKKGDKKPVFAPYIRQELNGFDVCITGFIGQNITIQKEVSKTDGDNAPKVKETEVVPLASLFKNKEYEVIDPESCVTSIITTLREEGADFILALSQLTPKLNKEILNSTGIDLVLGNSISIQNNYNIENRKVNATTKSGCEVIGHVNYYLSGLNDDVLGDKTMLEGIKNRLLKVKSEHRRLTEHYRTKDPDLLYKRAKNTKDGILFRKYVNLISILPEKIEELERDCKGNHFECCYIPISTFVSDQSGTAGAVWRKHVQSLSEIVKGLEDTIEKNWMERLDKLDDIKLLDPQSCSICHPVQFEHWKKTKHSTAFEPVQRMQCECNPTCSGCHSTGYRSKSGYWYPPAPERFRSVDCNVCHGLLENHVNDFLTLPSHGTLSIQPDKLGKLCSTMCHQSKRSPDFDIKSYIPRIACPSIDFNSDHMTELYRKQNDIMEKTLSTKGKLDTADQYLKAANYKIRLGEDKDTIITLLEKGLAIEPYNQDIVPLYSSLLIGEQRFRDALGVLEKYATKYQKNNMVHLEIIRLFLLAPDPDVHNPDSAIKYIEWFLSQIDENNIEVILLQAMAEKERGNKKIAIEALKRAELLNPPPAVLEQIRNMMNNIN